VQVTRRNASGLTQRLLGGVKLGQTSIPLNTGENVGANVYPITNLTLLASSLFTGSSATGVASNNSASAADDVLIWNGSAFTVYYYRTGAGWRTSTDPVTNRGNVPLAMGTGFLVMRNGGRGLFNWVCPQLFNQ
jgi:hypothetical protein